MGAATLPMIMWSSPRGDGDNRMKFASAERILGVTLVAYVVCDILLTPPAGLETRDPAKVTGLGYAVLGLLFIGLALAIVALVLLLRRSRRAPIVAVVAAVLYLPASLQSKLAFFRLCDRLSLSDVSNGFKQPWRSSLSASAPG